MEDYDRSDETDEGEEEVNDSGKMIFRAGRKKKGDGGDSLDEREVTIVNNLSSNILKNPFSQPGVSPLQFPSREAKTSEKGSTLSRPFPKRISDSSIITRQLR